MKDPVCSMEVDPKTTQYTSLYNGKTYYFCGEGCKKKFDKDPAKYVMQQLEQEAHEHEAGCGCEVKYSGPSYYLWVAMVILFIAILLAALLLRGFV